MGKTCYARSLRAARKPVVVPWWLASDFLKSGQLDYISFLENRVKGRSGSQ